MTDFFSYASSIRRCLMALLLAFSLATAGEVGAQGTVHGTVWSGDTAVPGANIGVRGTTRGAAAGADGVYRIADLPPGTYTLVASAIGFSAQERTVTLAAGETRRLDFQLEETVLRGEEVVVTGTMEEIYVKDSPVKVEVISSHYLQRQTTANIMDVIGTVNGLSQQLNCGVCNTNNIRINGVEGENTAVLIDGMPIMGALASVYGLNGINPSLIDRIEVIKGPQSTLYGTEALGGVINVLTKRPETAPTLSANLYAKSTQETSISLSLAPETGRFQTLVGGSGLYMNHFIDKNDDGFADQAKNKRFSLFGKGALAAPDGQRMLDLSAKYYHEDRNGGMEAFSEELRGSSSVYGESIYTRRAELLGELRPPTRGERLRLNMAYTFHDQNSFYGDQAYNARQQIAFGQMTYRQPLADRSELLVGGTLRYQTYDDNTPATAQTDRRFIPGLFVQNETVVTDELRLLGGLRVDHHDEHGFITAPRLSAKYSPSDETTLRLSGGTGFRVVNVFTEDHAALTGAREVVFSESLKPERSYNLTANLQQILPFGTNPLTLDLDGFYTRFSNQIIPDYDQDPNLIVYANLHGYSVSRGVAVNLSQNFTALPLTYNAGFTLLDVYTEESGTRRAVAYAPAFEGVLRATYHLHGLEVDLDYTATLTGPKRLPDSYVALGRAAESPAFTVHTLQLTKSLTDVNGVRGIGSEVYVSLENLFDYTQGSPLIGADDPFGEDFDTVYTYGPILGRTVAIGLRLNLR